MDRIRREKTIFHTLSEKVSKSLLSGNPQNDPSAGIFRGTIHHHNG
ncbi:MAG: hypothetical protein HC767_03220 [Akkermansiaceae bacterium]|nr:hypothetical protein [Akkermansiaceae bacterium]